MKYDIESEFKKLIESYESGRIDEFWKYNRRINNESPTRNKKHREESTKIEQHNI